MVYKLAMENEWVSNRVSSFAVLGPIVRMDHVKSSLIKLVSVYPPILELYKVLHFFNMMPDNLVVHKVVETACKLSPKFCEFVVWLFMDEQYDLNDEEAMKLYYQRFPAGASTKCHIHFAQMIHSHYFEEYDYGVKGNL